ncbi:hypothetical protein E1N52_35610 [Paraburkholderia guartelaensis]|uniref:Uncharacterized protein n=1 Tax=Paraburkholderia guartelaensis TaxID=2546446 RepID=A0A4R5L3Q1_9BURK|nr:hypothetical protein [Paraburkholderia guartelaensis]TDG03220.1 hypothetical protein E1N52_35610 [Paraburkholderia guartelaensis]
MSDKRSHASPGEGTSEAVASGKAVKAAKAPPPASKPQGRKPTPAEDPPRRVARHRREPDKREKVVRDTFTMPRGDYEQFTILKQRCLEAGVAVKKSELVRAGLLLLASGPTKRLLAAVKAVDPVKTGRPPKSK